MVKQRVRRFRRKKDKKSIGPLRRKRRGKAPGKKKRTRLKARSVTRDSFGRFFR